MNRMEKVPWWRPAVVSAAVGMMGCGLPVSRAPDVGSISGTHEVRYYVSCEECQVTYTSGINFESETVEGTWSQAVRVDAAVVRVVTLTVSPARAGVLIRRARIDIDGRREAEEQRRETQAFGDQVTLSVVLGSDDM